MLSRILAQMQGVLGSTSTCTWQFRIILDASDMSVIDHCSQMITHEALTIEVAASHDGSFQLQAFNLRGSRISGAAEPVEPKQQTAKHSFGDNTFAHDTGKEGARHAGYDLRQRSIGLCDFDSTCVKVNKN